MEVNRSSVRGNSSVYGSSDRLKEIQKVWEASTELRADEYVLSKLNNTSYGRRLLKKVDARLRIKKEKASDTPKPEFNPYRIYLFSDLLLIAVDRLNQKNDTSKDSLDGVVAFDEDFKVQSNYDTDASEENSEIHQSDGDSEIKQNERKVRKRYKLKMWLELKNLKFERVSKGNMLGWNFLYVERIEGRKHGKNVFVTRIKTQNVWCESQSLVDSFLKDLTETKLELTIRLKNIKLENSETASRASTRRATNEKDSLLSSISQQDAEHYRAAARRTGTMTSQGSSRSSTSTGTRRKYRAAVDALKERKQRQLEIQLLEGEEKEKAKTAERNLTLSALESKYGLIDTELEAEFTVEFGEGVMGFAIASDESIGVFVAKTATRGMADAARVTPGDRIIRVNDKPIKKDADWKEVVKLFKERPVGITFARSAEIDKKFEEEEKKAEEKLKAQAQEKLKEMKEEKRDDDATKTKDSQTGRKTGTRKRLHKQKREMQKKFGTRIEDIHALRMKQMHPEKLGETEKKIDKWFKALLEKITDKKERMLLHQLKEIYDTEIDNVNSLIIFEEFKRKFRNYHVHVQCKDIPRYVYGVQVLFCKHGNVSSRCKRESPTLRPLLNEKDIRTIFMNSKEIYEFNKVLLQKLQEGILKLVDDKSRWTVADIIIEYAPAFRDIMPYFQVYSFYASQYQPALARIEELCGTSPQFVALLRKREEREGMKLRDVLIKPVQRLTKYNLLYVNVLKFMEDYVQQLAYGNGDAEFFGSVDMKTMDKLDDMVKDAKKTLAAIEKVAHDVNEKVGDHEKIEAMLQVISELGGMSEVGDLITPTRKFIDSYRTYYTFSKATKRSPAQVYLFNDLLLLATEKNKGKGKNKGKNNNNNENIMSRLASKHFATSSSLGITKQVSVKSFANRVRRKESVQSKSSSLSRTSSHNSLDGGGSTIDISNWASAGKGRFKMQYQMKLDKTSNYEKLKQTDEENHYGFTFIETRREKIIDKKGKKNEDAPVETLVLRHDLYFEDENERDAVYDVITSTKEQFRQHILENKRNRDKLLNLPKKGYRNRKPGNTERLKALNKLTAEQKLIKVSSDS